MYETPLRIWRNISEIQNFGWIVWEVVEHRHEITEEDEVYIPDRDGYAMMVWATHYWTKEEANDFYMQQVRSNRFELSFVSKTKTETEHQWAVSDSYSRWIGDPSRD